MTDLRLSMALSHYDRHIPFFDGSVQVDGLSVIANGNVFAVLMDAVRVCSLGQITDALFEVGGQYRRNM